MSSRRIITALSEAIADLQMLSSSDRAGFMARFNLSAKRCSLASEVSCLVSDEQDHCLSC
jgi:hypothetical protein